MPRIQTYGEPRVAAASPVQARFRTADNGGGAAGALGKGLQALGASIDQVVQVRDAIDQNEQQRRIVDYRIAARGILSEYAKLEGQAALDARAGVDQQLDALRKEAVSAGSNDRVRNMLSVGLKPYIADARAQADQHNFSQFSVERDRTWSSRLALSADDAEAEAGRAPVASAAHVANGLSVLDEMASGHGWSSETLSFEKEKWQSAVHKRIASGMTQRGEITQAEAYIKAHEGKFTAGDLAGLMADLKGPLDKRAAAADVDRATAFVRSGSLEAPGKGGAVSDGGAIVRSLFPQARVTSTYRAPDHPLSKANPKSWHTKSHAAVDVAPIKGMTFAQYVQSFEKAGFRVLEAKNEVGEGRSAHATGDHWHIVLGKGGGATSDEPRRIDLKEGFAQIEQLARNEGWEVERKERAMAELEQRARRNDLLIGREQEDADAEASRIVLGLGAGFTDISQIPPSIRDRLKPQALEGYVAAARHNSKPAAVPANSATAMSLTVQSIMEPEKFAKVGLGAFVGKITPAEMESFLVTQAKIMREGPAGQTTRMQSDITSTITLYGGPIGLSNRSKPEEHERFLRVYNLMKDDLTRLTGGKRQPTEQELYQSFTAATRNVVMRKETTIFGIGTGRVNDVEKPVYDLDASDMPASVRNKIVGAFKQVYGREPTDGELAEQFRRGEGRYW